MADALSVIKRKPGRPAAAWWSLGDVAEITGLAAEVVSRLLDAVPSAIPGASKDSGAWMVPEKGIKAMLGGSIEQHATPAEVAQAVRRDVKTVYGWLKMMVPDSKGGMRALLPHREIIGLKLIPVSAVWSLPSRMPGPPPSFFARRKGL